MGANQIGGHAAIALPRNLWRRYRVRHPRRAYIGSLSRFRRPQDAPYRRAPRTRCRFHGRWLCARIHVRRCPPYHCSTISSTSKKRRTVRNRGVDRGLGHVGKIARGVVWLSVRGGSASRCPKASPSAISSRVRAVARVACAASRDIELLWPSASPGRSTVYSPSLGQARDAPCP